MSPGWLIRARLEVGRAAGALLRDAGTSRTSIPLAVIAGVALVAEAAGAGGTAAAGAVGRPLAVTWSWWILGWILLADGVAGLLRALPVQLSATGKASLGRLGRERWPGVGLRLAWLTAALAFLSSAAWRDRLVFRVAEGERFTSSREQLVSRDARRQQSERPVQLTFDVVLVEPAVPGRAGARAEIALEGGLREVLTRRLPTWLRWDASVRAVRTGLAVRYELASGAAAPLEGAFVKLSGDGGGASFIRSEATPYRIRVAVADPEALRRGAPPQLDVAALRGKLQVGKARVQAGEPFTFEGQSVRFPEWRPWVELEVVRDPGVPLAAAGALLAVGSLALAWAGRRARRTEAGLGGG